jgi:hypothetical protein
MIEQNGNPYRIQNARTARGHNNYKDLAHMLCREATDQALCNMGITKEMNEERKRGYAGKKIDHAAINEEFEKVLAIKIRDFVIEQPKAFQ